MPLITNNNYPSKELFEHYQMVQSAFCEGGFNKWIWGVGHYRDPSITADFLQEQIDFMIASMKKEVDDMIIRNVKFSTGHQFDSNNKVKFCEAIDPTNPFYQFFTKHGN